MPYPEYRVNCVMCETSFTATADTLDELVDVVATHLRYMKDQEDKPHHAYLKKHTGEDNRSATLLKKYPMDKSAILNSKGFSWDIIKLVPYTLIHKVIEQQEIA